MGAKMTDINELNLNSEFKSKINVVIERCKKEKIIIVPYFGIRDVYVQAKFWRQSRSSLQITKAFDWLKSKNAPWLAKVLMDVGPQYGRWCTNALPGFSWHQYGEAIDCFVLENDKAIWDVKHPGYRIYAREAELLGLTSGYYWRKRDAVHVQLRSERLLKIYSVQEINNLMEKQSDEGFHL